jgi:peptidylprolyl isomerase domain and WD repeat-containing protein 1
MLYLEKLDFERRLAVEKELDKYWEYKNRDNTNCVYPSIGFDESDSFLFFGSLLGIKIISIHTNRLVRIIGKVENTERFL